MPWFAVGSFKNFQYIRYEKNNTMYKELTACPLFRGMSVSQIEALLPEESVMVTEYKKGDVIAKRDSAYSGLMIVINGSATGQMSYEDGKTVIIDRIGVSQLIAPAFLFGGYNRLPIDVVADEPTKVLTLHRGLIFEFMQGNVVILSNFIDIISNRANVWSKKIYFLSMKSLRAKAASYILDHTTESNSVMPIPDIADIADIFGTTLNSLMDVFAQMAKHNLITVDKHSINVLDRRAIKGMIK